MISSVQDTPYGFAFLQAVALAHDHVLADVYQAARQIPRVRRTKRRVGKPFLAPCVEMKNSKTVRPSRKFARIGISMISPDGSAIRPRMPASCRIWFVEPLRARVGHHVDRIEFGKALHQGFGHLVGRFRPDLDDVFFSFFVGQEARV